MKALLLCDRESGSVDGLDLRVRVHDALQSAGCEVQRVVLNCDEIRPCLGCFQCWVKTPGLCVMTNDSANEIAGFEMRCDVLVLLARITYGGYSADIKAFLDRSIPNISPLFEIYHGEMHHKMRYERFPLWIAVGYGESTSRERKTFLELTQRNALNMRPPKHYAFTMHSADEIHAVMRALKDVLSEEVPS